jgi:hypothetical protein
LRKKGRKKNLHIFKTVPVKGFGKEALARCDIEEQSRP